MGSLDGKELPKRRLPTLDEFIQQSLAHGHRVRFPRNAWVTAYGFKELYVRVTMRGIAGQMLSPVLDLANMTVRNPGHGTFTRLVERLREEYPFLHLFVEQTHERFGAHLLKLGFTKLDPAIHGNSYFMKAGGV